MKPQLIALAIATSCLAASAQNPADSAALAPATVNAATPVLKLSRQECIAIALQDNPTIRVADIEVKKTDYSKLENRAALFPQINFSGAYQRAIELQTINMNMGGQQQSLKMGSDNSWNFGFSASMPIIAPQLWKALKISDTQILQNLEAARESRLNLIDQVNKAYYTLLLAEASLQVVRDSYDIAVLNAETYKKQYEAGTATEYDVLRSSVQVKNVEPELLQAQIAVRQSKLQLKVLMGIEKDTDICANITLKEMQQDMYGYTMALQRDLSGNTTLRTLDIQTKLAEQNVDLKKLAWVPTLATQFNIAWSALSNGNAFRNMKFHPYSNVALSLSVPIFSGGSKYYGLKGAQLSVKQLQLQRENLVNSLNMQVDLALDNINREVAQIASSEEGVKQADKAYQIMQKSFDIGAATYLNLRDSELARTSARLAYYQAIYNYLVSTSELDLLLGKETALAAK